jgi:hypothetical protein
VVARTDRTTPMLSAYVITPDDEIDSCVNSRGSPDGVSTGSNAPSRKRNQFIFP